MSLGQNHQNRTEALDGLRGVAALFVFCYHYLLYFYSNFSKAFFDESRTNSSLNSIILQSPINFLFNGPLAVNIFFVISGFVLSYGYFLQPNLDNLRSGAFRRYFRLVIPIAIVELLSFILLSTHLYFNKEVSSFTHTNGFLGSVYLFTPNFEFMIKEAFYHSLISGFTYPWQNSYNNVIWTLHIEYLGSLLVYCILALVGKTRPRFFIYFILIILLGQTNFIGFVLGLALADIYSEGGIEFLKRNDYLNYFLLIFSILLGCYHGQTTGWYHYLWGFLLNFELATRTHLQWNISAFLLIVSLLHSKSLNLLLKSSPFKFLGRISYSNYLIHMPLLCSFSSFLFLFFIKTGYLNIVLIHILVLGLTIPTLFFISFLFTIFIDEPTVRYLKKLYKTISHKQSK